MPKSTHIVRRLDELGRIVLPIDLRRSLEIGDKEALEISTDGDVVIIKKSKPACIFCSKEEAFVRHNEKVVCKECFESLTDLANSIS